MFALELCEPSVPEIVGVHCPPKDSGCARGHAGFPQDGCWPFSSGPHRAPIGLWASVAPGFELEETEKKEIREGCTPRAL